MVLMNDRDVLLSTTSLTDGGRANGIIFADPFGQHDKANQIEKIKFDTKNKASQALQKIKKICNKKERMGQVFHIQHIHIPRAL